MPSVLNDEPYFVFEQCCMWAMHIVLITLVLLQLKNEDERTPRSKFATHRMCLVLYVIGAIRSIDPRGRYQILPQPAVGFLLLNSVPFVGAQMAVYLRASITALARISRQPVPLLVRIHPVVMGCNSLIVNGIFIARYVIPLDWLEGVGWMIIGSVIALTMPLNQLSTYRLSQVIKKHLLATSSMLYVRVESPSNGVAAGVAGESGGSGILSPAAQQELRDNLAALWYWRLLNLTAGTATTVILLMLGITTIQARRTDPDAVAYDLFSYHIFIWAVMINECIVLWFAWEPLKSKASIAPGNHVESNTKTTVVVRITSPSPANTPHANGTRDSPLPDQNGLRLVDH